MDYTYQILDSNCNWIYVSKYVYEHTPDTYGKRIIPVYLTPNLP